MSITRYNVEKHRLIEMVRMNPILWDCRLPHYKRSDKRKDMKWCELGREFNVSGERVQRTFTSLREIFRRELNNEKLLGDRFKSKWEFYEAMGFLKDVIRERKTRDRVKPDPRIGIPANKDDIDEYAFYTPHPSNRCCPTIHPDVIINDSATPPPQPDNSLSRTTSPSLTIKEEITDHDEETNEDSSKPETQHKRFKRQQQHAGNLGAIHSPGPTASTSSYQRPSAKHESYPGLKNYDDDDDDAKPTVLRQTPREILHLKFGEFLSARLNTLTETAANDLMNRILMLIVEK